MKCSIGAWAFERDAPLDEIAARIRPLGYRGLEVIAREGVLHQSMAPTLQREIAARLRDDAGVEISVLVPDTGSCFPDEMAVEEYRDALLPSIRLCVECGVRILRVCTRAPVAKRVPGELYEQRFAQLVANWRHAADVAADVGVALSCEFEPCFWLNRPSELERLAVAVDHPSFGYMIDTSHLMMMSKGSGQLGEPEIPGGGIIECAKRLQPWLNHLHLADSDGTLLRPGGTSTHLPLGDGELHFPDLLSALEPRVHQLEWWSVDLFGRTVTDRDLRVCADYVQEPAGQS